ncbi:hypothetical protein AVEN_119701-1 [Araneus ventricosus]|uniref:Uncharacterized protein n=1 Tax=Araneus ventricosus TaxID=182803 RepID=A0A4Y2GDN0_ARAVE|nr:hypothetical protein AVEN_119701-1 [Araneus ventricosus]
MGKIRFFQMFSCSFECLPLSLANANFKGNYYLLNLDGKSFDVIGMRGIKTLSHLTMPVITVAHTMFGHRCVICNCVPMHSLSTSKLCINSTGTPTFNLSLSESTPDNSKELKNSTGYDVTCYCPLAYLQIDIL